MIKKQAQEDFKKLNENPSVNLYFEINKKISESSEYKKSFSEEIEKFRSENNIIVPSENYIKSKLDNINQEAENLPDVYKIKLETDFEKKFPNGIVFSNEDKKNDNSLHDKKSENDISFSYEKFKDAVELFIKTDIQNDNIMKENTKYMIDHMSKNQHEFNAFSERFFNDGILNNSLPENFEKFKASDVKNLSKTLSINIIDKAKEIIKKSKDLDVKKEISESLTYFRKEQFKGAYEDIKKSNALKQAITQKNHLNNGLKI